MERCIVCPRMCGADRSSSRGFCNEGNGIRVSKAMLHHWEEPCISGCADGVGSGAVFFSGCSLKCVFCQNKAISRGEIGEVLTPEELAKTILSLQSRGAYNINFVTPTHFTLQILEALKIAGDDLKIPVVWNTSGYEKPETIRLLKNRVSIFLTDFKYCSKELSMRYSSAPDYAEYALSSLAEMVKITGKTEIGGDGLMKKGVIVRHLVLPRSYRDSIDVLSLIEKTVGAENILLSLMAQYTPEFLDEGFGEIARRVTTFEYEKVLSHAEKLGFDGFMQSRSSASAAYTPDFQGGKITE